MDYTSHIAGAALTTIAIGYASNRIGLDINVVALTVGGVFGGLVCDIDTPYSWIGSKVKPIAQLLYNTVGHRGITHSLFFAGVAGVVIGIFNVTIGAGVTLGILSHIFLDMITPNTNGTCLYYPFSKKRIQIFKRHS